MGRQWGERESGSNDTCCFACFVLFSRVSLFVPLFFPPRRSYAGIFFVFVLFRPCSSYLFLFSTCVLAAFLIFLQHVLQNSCRLFVFVYFVLIFHFFLVWLVLTCSRSRHASISLALPGLIAVVSAFLFLTVCDHIIRISLG